MKIVKDERKRGIVTLRVESDDDVWVLFQVIHKGDIVSGKTVRKIKLEGERKSEVIKKLVFLKLVVEKVEFLPELLRVSGKIVEGPEDVARGSYHTFSVGMNDLITVEKEVWLAHEWEQVREACAEVRGKVLLCVLDREECMFAVMTRQGYDVLAHVRGDVVKKQEGGSGKEWYPDVAKLLCEYVDRLGVAHVIIASPAFWKEELFARISDEGVRKKVVLATCSSVGKNAFDEVLKRGEVLHVLREDVVRKGEVLVDRVLECIGKGGRVTYGVVHVRRAAELGAVAELVVSAHLLRKRKEEDLFDEIQEMMRAVERARGVVHIVSSDSDGRKKLDALGGVAALLRFNVE